MVLVVGGVELVVQQHSRGAEASWCGHLQRAVVGASAGGKWNDGVLLLWHQQLLRLLLLWHLQLLLQVLLKVLLLGWWLKLLLRLQADPLSLLLQSWNRSQGGSALVSRHGHNRQALRTHQAAAHRLRRLPPNSCLLLRLLLRLLLHKQLLGAIRGQELRVTPSLLLPSKADRLLLQLLQHDLLLSLRLHLPQLHSGRGGGRPSSRCFLRRRIQGKPQGLLLRRILLKEKLWKPQLICWWDGDGGAF